MPNEMWEAQKELVSAIRDIIPLDGKDARHQRLADAIENLIDLRIFAALHPD